MLHGEQRGSRRTEPGLVADLAGAGMAVLFVAAWFVLPLVLGRDGSPMRNDQPAKVGRRIDG